MHSDFGFFRTGPLSLTQKSAIKRVFLLWFWKEQAARMHFACLAKMHLGMLLLIFGPFSGFLRNGDYGSKRVQIEFIDVLTRRKT